MVYFQSLYIDSSAHHHCIELFSLNVCIVLITIDMPSAMLEINLIQMIQGDLFIQALSLDCCNNDLLPFPELSSIQNGIPRMVVL